MQERQLISNQQRLEKAKEYWNKVSSVIDTDGNDQEIEQILSTILYNQYFETDDVLLQILNSLKKEYHDEQKELEKLRDKVEKLNEAASSL